MSAVGDPPRAGRVLAVVGPTAAGKSALGVALAEAVGGEVVNADAMQLYRGMDIGTAKLPVDERGGVPHHLLDVWEVTEPASVAVFQGLVRSCIDELLARGVTPVVVGGSGLYLRAALDQLVFPGTDPALRDRLEAELAAVGPGELHRRLAARDPDAAAAVLASNGRRIVRALEVIELTGSFRARLPEPVPAYADLTIIGLDADDLDARIARRVEQMWDRGLVDEVRALERIGLRRGRTARRAVGYREVLAMFEGLATGQQTREEIVRATRRLARRQRSWLRRDQRIRWFGTGSTRTICRAVGSGRFPRIDR